jgi:hypothetical protein
MKNRKETTPKVATLASKTLQNPNAGKVAKTLAASVLSQSDKARDNKAKKK